MDDLDETFFQSDAGQSIANAHRYISAAGVVRFSDEYRANEELLKIPVLHLLSHGIELLLKYPLLRSGMSKRELKSHDYGHDLRKLWRCKENENLRAHVLHTARETWDEARASGKWKLDDFEDDPCTLLPDQVDLLAILHGKDSDFALRYTIDGPQRAPQSAFLIDTFGDVAGRTLMNPNHLDLIYWEETTSLGP